MRNISEAAPGRNTHLRFYLAQDKVVFEYYGPFDTDSGEWINSTAHFPLAAFKICIDSFGRQSNAEVAGINGENLQIARRPDGTVDLTLTGCKDGSDISVFGVNLSTWDLSATRVNGDDSTPTPTTERYLATKHNPNLVAYDVLGLDLE